MYTHNFFNLIKKLEDCKGFLSCLHKLNLISEREKQVLYHNMHSRVLDMARNL